MKKLLVGLLFISIIVTPLFVFAQTNYNTSTDFNTYFNEIDIYDSGAYSEEISDYNIVMEIQEDSSLIITEKIVYDFKSLQRHGIYRDIPYKYKDQKGANYKLRLKVLSITDEKGAPYQYKTSRGKSWTDFSIKIGDPDSFVTGVKTYIIKYKVDRGMRYFDDHDELYWNAIGQGWTVGIVKGAARIILPKEVDKNLLKYDCFTGSYGSTAKDCAMNVVDGKTVDFVANGSLMPYSGMTIVLGFPKNIIQKPVSKEIMWFVIDNWPLILIPLSFLICFFLWFTRGRDPKGKGTIVAQYEAPDNLRPGEAGVILDHEANNKDVSATLIDLAVRGYVKIKEVTKGEYQFIKLKDAIGLEEYEKKLINDIFDGSNTKLLSALKDKFAKKLEAVKNQLYDDITKKEYFPKNPAIEKSGYLGCGALIAIASIFLGIFLQSLTYFVGFLLSGLIIVFFSFFMSRRTRKGVLAYEHILGFRDFLSVTEKERLKFHNAPEKKPELFEKFLPYAMVLGVEGQWAKQFEGIYNQKPSWYESYDSRPFMAYAFVSSLNSLSSKTSSTFTSTPKTSSGSFGGSGFGGGGFSGGGGGGGGGGSW